MIKSRELKKNPEKGYPVELDYNDGLYLELVAKELKKEKKYDIKELVKSFVEGSSGVEKKKLLKRLCEILGMKPFNLDDVKTNLIKLKYIPTPDGDLIQMIVKKEDGNYDTVKRET